MIACFYEPLFIFEKNKLIYGFGSSSMLILAKFLLAQAFIKGDTGVVCAVMSIVLVIVLTISNALWE